MPDEDEKVFTEEFAGTIRHVEAFTSGNTSSPRTLEDIFEALEREGRPEAH